MKHTPAELKRIYDLRFTETAAYRRRVWSILCEEIFQAYVPEHAAVLDLGCGYGEFINQIRARERHGMDLNPAVRRHLADGVIFHEQDCSASWSVAPASLDVVFSSNFLEHLPDKACLLRTLGEVSRSLKPGGRFIAMGPNVRFLGGSYWDFLDHHVVLSDRSLAEALELSGFRIEKMHPQFLPYTLVNARPVPNILVRMYLRCRPLWRWKGRQFLAVASRI